LGFSDLSIIISIIILITLIVFVLNKILRFVKNKYYFWE
jgi:ABC-type nitrate/sulfonate/bicarbonate transport system permease component